MTVGVRIELRRDTAANWTSNNPVLLAGEPGFETDTGKEKRGDGLTAWTSLAYMTDVSRLPSSVEIVPSLAESGTVYVTQDGNDSHNGLSWKTAFATIQAAINALPASSAPDTYGRSGTVRVGPGQWNVASSHRVDTGCSTTSGSATVLDPSITAADQWSLVYGTNLAALTGNYPTYQITSVTPGVSFTAGGAYGGGAGATGSGLSLTIVRPGVIVPPGVMLVGSGTSASSGRTGANFLNEYAGTIIQDTGTDITVAVQTGAGEDNTASRATIMDIAIWGTQTNVGPAQNQSATYSAKTTASSGTGTVTSLTVGALPYAIASGVSFQLSTDVNATKITFTLTAPAAQGATSLSVSASASVGTTITAGFLWFNSNLAGNTNTFGIWTGSLWNLSLVRCDVSNHGRWGVVVMGNAGSAFSFYDCVFFGNGTVSSTSQTGAIQGTSGVWGPGIFMSNCSFIFNVGCGLQAVSVNLQSCNWAVTYKNALADSGIGVYQLNAAETGVFVAVGCWFESSAYIHIKTAGGYGTVIKGCNFQGAGVTSYGVSLTNTNMAFEDCTFEGHTAPSIVATSTASVVSWSNCYCYDTTFVSVIGGANYLAAVATGSGLVNANTMAPAFSAFGLTGATAASRYVGATASGAPTSGTFLTGDWLVDQTGGILICTTGGISGTWANSASGGSLSGVSVSGTPSAGQVLTATSSSAADWQTPGSGPLVSTQQSGTGSSAYTFALTDAQTVVETTGATAATFTIPTNASVAFPVGTAIEVFQDGAGQVTIAAAGGVTLRSDGSKVHTAAQYATIGLRQRAANEWVLSGDLS
jgi:hypothetical protein